MIFFPIVKNIFFIRHKASVRPKQIVSLDQPLEFLIRTRFAQDLGNKIDICIFTDLLSQFLVNHARILTLLLHFATIKPSLLQIPLRLHCFHRVPDILLFCTNEIRKLVSLEGINHQNIINKLRKTSFRFQ